MRRKRPRRVEIDPKIGVKTGRFSGVKSGSNGRFPRWVGSVQKYFHFAHRRDVGGQRWTPGPLAKPRGISGGEVVHKSSANWTHGKSTSGAVDSGPRPKTRGPMACVSSPGARARAGTGSRMQDAP